MNETLHDKLNKKLGQSSSKIQTNKTHAGTGSIPGQKEIDVCRTQNQL